MTRHFALSALTLVLSSTSLRAQCSPSASPLQATIAGRTFRASADVWLNLMGYPDSLIANANSNTRAPFRAVIVLSTVGATTLPAGISADSVWFRAKGHPWSDALSGLHTWSTDTSLMRRVWAGPSELFKADSVDAAVRLRLGSTYVCLRAPRAALVRAS